MPKQLTVKVVSAAQQASDSQLLLKPNPGDMMMALVFGWAFFCFFLVTVGDSLLRRLAGLSRNDEYRDLLLQSDQALGFVMIVGSMALILSVFLCHKYPKALLISLVFSLSFANATLAPLHDLAFALKYLGLVYLGIYAAFCVYKNFWRILSTPFVRLLVIFTGWIIAVCVLVGGQLEDIWYAGTIVCTIIGFAVFFVYDYNNREGLEEFFNAISWGAVIAVAIHLTAPFLAEEYVYQGRFQSFFIRATGFSVTMTPLVIILLWRAMTEKDPQTAVFFTVFALIGMALVLWSGSRSPIAATLVGGGLLWLRFRSRLFLVMFCVGALGLAAQLLLNIGEGVDTTQIEERLANADTGRFELWAEYLKIAAESPIYGYASSGLGFAIAGQDIGGFLRSVGATEIDYESVHNTYIAVLMRFGVVGLILFIVLIVLALYRAKQVLFSARVPDDEKRVYILPAVLIPSICFTQIFEDSVFGTGKGSVESLIFFVSIFICQVYGTRLINYYERGASVRSEDAGLAGLKITAERELAAR